MTIQVRDTSLDTWAGARVFVSCKLFFYLREKTIFFLAKNVRQFFFYVSSKKWNIFFFSYAFPIMYVTIRWFFWSIYFSSISTKNLFILPTYFLNIFSTPPSQILKNASLIVLFTAKQDAFNKCLLNVGPASQTVCEWILHYIAFCTIMAISGQKEARSRDSALLLSNDYNGSLQCTVRSPVGLSVVYHLMVHHTQSWGYVP